MPKREIGEVSEADRLSLRNIGARAKSLGCGIHPSELRRTLATLDLDDGGMDFAALLAADDDAFLKELLDNENGIDVETGRLRDGKMSSFRRPRAPFSSLGED